MLNGFPMENIRNKNETRVIKILKEVFLEFPDFDNCQLCIEDVYALSLKHLPAIYAQKGSIILKHDVSDEDIRVISRYAINQVMQRPRHG